MHDKQKCFNREFRKFGVGWKGISIATIMIALLGTAPRVHAFANYVYHERTSNVPGCGTDPYLDVASPSPSQAVNLRWKVEYQFSTDHTVVYYTTDGSRPAGSFGVGSGSTRIAQGTYLCTFSDGKQHLVDVVGGIIPAQPAGTTVKYIFGAWSSGGGPEIFGNSGTCLDCGDFEVSTRATLFQYSVTAPLSITCPPDLTNVPTDPGQCYATGVSLGTPVASETGPGTSVINNAPSQFPKGETMVTWTATGTGGNQATCTQKVVVKDLEAPVISSIPANITVSCPSEVPAANDAAVVATDNCGGTLTVTHDNDVISSAVCQNRYTITRTYHVADSSGNSSSASQTIVVNDTIKPVVVAGTIAVCYPSQSEAEAAALAATTATDNCSGTPLKTVATTGSPCNAIISVTATDACGNSDTVVYHAQINNQSPVISSVSAAVGGLDAKNCAVNIQQGMVNISVQANHICNLVDGHPSVTLANGLEMASADFVNESPLGTFNYTWPITPATANGTWTATINAADQCQTATSNFTLCVNRAQVTGLVQSQGFSGGNRVVTFAATGGVSNKIWNLNLAFVGEMANYVLTDVPSGTTGISAKTVWSLREKLPVTFDLNGQATANFISDGTAGWSDATDHYLRGGDFSGNNIINFQDYSVLGNNFFSFNTIADITGDGQVDYDDYFILVLNWLTAGDPQ
ncbi:MAG: hypothetical protein JWM16_2439 [Verrucomicrobiales bacterium]|nr:hypothetical protein [Verrucomicrobiales bacterium]